MSHEAPLWHAPPRHATAMMVFAPRLHLIAYFFETRARLHELIDQSSVQRLRLEPAELFGGRPRKPREGHRRSDGAVGADSGNDGLDGVGSGIEHGSMPSGCWGVEADGNFPQT